MVWSRCLSLIARRAFIGMALFACAASGAVTDVSASERPLADDATSLCSRAITIAEDRYGIPRHLLRAIALAESGRLVSEKAGEFEPWPWTITAEGRGRYVPSRTEAVEMVRNLRERGIDNIDVGCMQINLMHHGGAFETPDMAFDPDANVSYGASFLRRLYALNQSWSAAIGRYHSFEAERGDEYTARVLRILEDLGGSVAVYHLPPAETPAGAYLRRQIVIDAYRTSGMAVPPGLLDHFDRTRASSSDSSVEALLGEAPEAGFREDAPIKPYNRSGPSVGAADAEDSTKTDDEALRTRSALAAPGSSTGHRPMPAGPIARNSSDRRRTALPLQTWGR